MRIKIEGVSHSYGKKCVIDGLDWNVPVGVTGLLGPNGAGKTTLLSLIATLKSLQVGEITFAEDSVKNPVGRAAVRRQLGFLPQHFKLVERMSVLDTVSYAAWLNGVAEKDAVGCARRSLDEVGIIGLDHDQIRTLSGGMRQRVGLATTLAHQPTVVILDEPTVGLDPTQRGRFRSLVRELGRTGRLIILSTHLIEDVAQVCDYVAILVGGQKRFFGDYDEVAAAVAHRSGDTETSRVAILEQLYNGLVSG